jgi:hypothetical protein
LGSTRGRWRGCWLLGAARISAEPATDGPKLDPFLGIIDRILEEDKSHPAKQHHTAKRIFERLHDEHGYAGGITIVMGYVPERRQRLREMLGRNSCRIWSVTPQSA